jgi:bifunctional non-homologous end joining protein LigD
VVFDLDPGEGLGFPEIVAAARDMRAVLERIGLQSFVQTTGGKGLHVVAPLERSNEWSTVKAFARQVAERMSAEEPARFLSKNSIAARRGRVFIDYLRNDPTSTAVAPYSTRSREGAPVATPVTWEELSEELDPRSFNVNTVPHRSRRLGPTLGPRCERSGSGCPVVTAPPRLAGSGWV